MCSVRNYKNDRQQNFIGRLIGRLSGQFRADNDRSFDRSLPRFCDRTSAVARSARVNPLVFLADKNKLAKFVLTFFIPHNNNNCLTVWLFWLFYKYQKRKWLQQDNFCYSKASRAPNAIDPVAVESHENTLPHHQASPCNRSLDSGFSDSDRSHSPEIYDDGTPKRRRHRRRVVRNVSVVRERPHLAKRIHHRLSSLWKDTEGPPDPAHTSTPKAEKHRVKRCLLQSDEINWSNYIEQHR